MPKTEAECGHSKLYSVQSAGGDILSPPGEVGQLGTDSTEDIEIFFDNFSTEVKE